MWQPFLKCDIESLDPDGRFDIARLDPDGLFLMVFMENAQRTRTKGLVAPKAEDARILDALRKASAEAKRKATKDGVPFVGEKRKSWAVPK